MSSRKSIFLDLPSGVDGFELDDSREDIKKSSGMLNKKDTHTEEGPKAFNQTSQSPEKPVTLKGLTPKKAQRWLPSFFEGMQERQKRVILASFAILLCAALLPWVLGPKHSYLDINLSDRDSLFTFDLLHESEVDDIGTELPMLLMVQSSLKQVLSQASKLPTSQNSGITDSLEDANALLDVIAADLRTRDEQTQKLRDRIQDLRYKNAAFETELRLQNNRIANLTPYKNKYIESRDKLRSSNDDVIALRAEARRIDMRLKSVAEEYAKLQINFEEQLDEQLAVYRQELRANQKLAGSIPMVDTNPDSTPKEQAQELAFLNNSLEIMRKDLASVQHEHRLALIELETLRAKETQRLEDEALTVGIKPKLGLKSQNPQNSAVKKDGQNQL